MAKKKKIKYTKTEIKALRNQGYEVYTKGSYRWWGLLGDVLAFGVPLTYIGVDYNLFTMRNDNPLISITGWGYMFVGIIALFVKERVLKKVQEFNTYMESTSKRIKRLGVFMTVLIVLALSRFFIDKLIVLMAFITVGYGLAFIPYNKYDDIKKSYETIKKQVEEQEQKNQLDNKEVIVI